MGKILRKHDLGKKTKTGKTYEMKGFEKKNEKKK